MDGCTDFVDLEESTCRKVKTMKMQYQTYWIRTIKFILMLNLLLFQLPPMV